MEPSKPCPKCARSLYGVKEGPLRDPHIRYYCPACREGWNEPTLDQERRADDAEVLRRSPSSNPKGTTGGIPNSDGYP